MCGCMWRSASIRSRNQASGNYPLVYIVFYLIFRHAYLVYILITKWKDFKTGMTTAKLYPAVEIHVHVHLAWPSVMYFYVLAECCTTSSSINDGYLHQCHWRFQPLILLSLQVTGSVLMWYPARPNKGRWSGNSANSTKSPRVVMVISNLHISRKPLRKQRHCYIFRKLCLLL